MAACGKCHRHWRECVTRQRPVRRDNEPPTNHHHKDSGSASSQFIIAPKPLTAIITGGNKIYDGNTSVATVSCSLSGVIAPDVVTCAAGGATFDSSNVGSRTVTASQF